MSRYRVISADPDATEVEFEGGALAVGTHVDLPDTEAEALVAEGKLVADPLPEEDENAAGATPGATPDAGATEDATPAEGDWVGNHTVE